MHLSKTDHNWLSQLANSFRSRRGDTFYPEQGQLNEHIVGSPEINAQVIDGHQLFPYSCAVKAQEVILERFTNREISEVKLAQFAEQKGWYDPSAGTPFESVGKLLEESGIPVSRKYDGTIFDLYEHLAKGEQVIIGVDGAELRGDSPIIEFLEEFIYGEIGDHAVIVSGINARTGEVIITDPATGQTCEYQFEHFSDAWSDAGFFMVNTELPAPPWVPGMEGFDYAIGHVDGLGGIDYSEFSSDYGDLISTPNYTSQFGLADFLEVTPLSFGRELVAWSGTADSGIPADWEERCIPDADWLGSVAGAGDIPLDPSELDSDSFLDVARDIFAGVFEIT